MREADLQVASEGKSVVGELENVSAHVFDVTLRIHLKDADGDILGEEKALLHHMKPHDIWRFKVPISWPQTEGFSLKAMISVDL